MRRSVPILAALFAGLAACPASAAQSPAQRYQSCLAMAQSDPHSALDAAQIWQSQGGGAAAAHCAAVALVGLKRYDQGAAALDKLARNKTIGAEALRADLFDQAGNAWLLAAQPARAVHSLSAGLDLDPENADLYADRARAEAMRKNWSAAERDLSSALRRAPRRPELYVLRASARRALHREKDALADVRQALKLAPTDAQALVERGAIRFDVGDLGGAKADWQRAMAVAPGSDAANSARQHLQQLQAHEQD